jgi:hypothetical protein
VSRRRRTLFAGGAGQVAETIERAKKRAGEIIVDRIGNRR